MKILMIAPQPFYSERGTPMNVKLLCKVLGESGHSIDLVVFPTGSDLNLKNVNIIRIPNIFNVSRIPIGPSKIKFLFDIVLTVAVFILCLTKKYDIIHGIEEGGFLSILFGHLFQKKSVFDMDSCISDQLKYSGFIKNSLFIKFVTHMEKWAIEHSSLVVTVCSSLSEKARSFDPTANIVQIEDIPIFSQQNQVIDSDIPTNLIKNCNLGENSIVLYTGNLLHYQGIDLLLEAWENYISMEESDKNSKLVMIGGPKEKVDYFQKLASRKNIQDSVCWIGERPSHEMVAWMELSRVLVSPRSEGSNTPLKIYTYMDSNRPIVATRRQTHTQVLDDSTAFLAKPEPKQFGRAIYEALNNHTRARELSQNAKKIVETKYSYSEFKRKLLSAYAEISE